MTRKTPAMLPNRCIPQTKNNSSTQIIQKKANKHFSSHWLMDAPDVRHGRRWRSSRGRASGSCTQQATNFTEPLHTEVKYTLTGRMIEGSGRTEERPLTAARCRGGQRARRHGRPGSRRRARRRAPARPLERREGASEEKRLESERRGVRGDETSPRAAADAAADEEAIVAAAAGRSAATAARERERRRRRTAQNSARPRGRDTM